MERTIKVSFDKEIQNFLVSKQYTHVLNKGHKTEESEDNDYYIVPLKKEDLDLLPYKNDPAIDLINSNDVCDMAGGIEFINFIIEVPLSEYEQYLSLN